MNSELYILIAFLIMMFVFYKFRKIFLSFLDARIAEIKISLHKEESAKNNAKILMEESEAKILSFIQRKQEKIAILEESAKKDFVQKCQAVEHSFAIQKTLIQENFDSNYHQLKNFLCMEIIEKNFADAKHNLSNIDPNLLNNNILALILNQKTRLVNLHK